MPCYQVNLLSVKIEAADKELLEKAIKKLGFSYVRDKYNVFTINVSDSGVYGTIIINNTTARIKPGLQKKLNEIKQAYSEQVIAAAAEEFSWTVTEDEEGQIVLRRYS